MERKYQPTEQDFMEFRRLCALLHIPCPEVFLHVTITDRRGRVISDRLDRSHTWIRNFYNSVLYSVARCTLSTGYAAGSLQMKSTTDSVVAPIALASIIDGSAGSSNGIVVGTGTTAWSFENWKLATPIVHGNGAGQLAYSAMTAQAPTYTAGTKTWDAPVKRILNNNSGGAINIGEVGLNMYSTLYYMLSRDVRDPVDAVPDGAQVTITYTISWVFPA